jgi:hypothetical protein
MFDDPIVNEVRKVRSEHAAKFKFNIKAIARDIKKYEKNHKEKLVTLSPKQYLKPTGS